MFAEHFGLTLIYTNCGIYNVDALFKPVDRLERKSNVYFKFES